MNRPVLVTGAAGFIGSAVAERLLADDVSVIGVDNLNDYYDPALKKARIARVEGTSNSQKWLFECKDIADKVAIEELFATHNPRAVIHLAAQAGVRYSLENPAAYVQSNLVGFGHILEGCRHHQVEHLVMTAAL